MNARPSRNPSRRGPRTDGQDTRAAIIDAARSEFADRGYEATSLRGIARVAGVDPALVHHYFAGKAAVFAATIELDIDPRALIVQVAAGPPDQAGARLVRMFLSLWDPPERRLRIQALIRSVVSAPEPSDSPLRAILLGEIVMPYCDALGVDQVERRASMIVSQMVGLALTRYVIGLPAIHSSTHSDLIAAAAPVIQHYLFGDLSKDPFGTGDDPGGAGATEIA